MIKIKQIDANDRKKGYEVNLECDICWGERTFTGITKKELMQNIKDGGWKINKGKLFGREVTSIHCGCTTIFE